MEKDLQTLAAELEQGKKESEAAKRTAQKAHNDLKAVFDTCRKGIGAMCQHIFGKFVSLLTPSMHCSEVLLNWYSLISFCRI